MALNAKILLMSGFAQLSAIFRALCVYFNTILLIVICVYLFNIRKEVIKTHEIVIQQVKLSHPTTQSVSEFMQWQIEANARILSQLENNHNTDDIASINTKLDIQNTKIEALLAQREYINKTSSKSR